MIYLCWFTDQLSIQFRKSMTIEESLQAILTQSVDEKRVFGTSFALKKGNWTWQGNAGNLETGQPYFIASTTKLFTSALILKLAANGEVELDNSLQKYVGAETLNGLHVHKGLDCSAEITIRHLLAHTSGLPDYFEGEPIQGRSLEYEVTHGKDQGWTFDQCIDRTKQMKPLFRPGKPGKAKYSDTNYQLLGRIIERVTGKSFEENCIEHIIKPLGLFNTYLFTDSNDTKPIHLYYKNSELWIPKAMASFGPDGGMVSNSSDMLLFIEAFMTGRLFPSEYLKFMQIWNSIFFPLKAGVGIHLFKLPWFFNPTGSIPHFIGHSGLSGALAYYCPKENVFAAGTVNQVAYPDTSFRVLIKLALQLKKSGV
jgi:CubicO group peptidase (beta-lactamase class C family)